MSETSRGPILLPLSTSELIRRTIQIYADHWQWFLITAAVVLIPLAFIELAVDSLTGSGLEEAVRQSTNGDATGIGMFTLTSPSFLVIMVSFLIQQVFLQGTVTFMTSEAILGRATTPLTAVQHIRDRYLPLAASMLIVFAIVVGVSILLAMVFFLCGLGVGIILYLTVTLFTLLVPVMILEHVSIGDGIRRTWSLSKRRFWSLFGLLVVLTVLTFLISIIFQRADVLVSRGDGEGGLHYAELLLNLVYQIVITPIAPIALTLMYYDTRIRLEGLGLALETADLTHVRLSDLPSPKLPARFTTADFSNMMVLSLVLMLVSVVIVLLFGLYVTSLV